MKCIYFLVWSVCYLISLLPMWILYRLSDILYFLVYYIIGYRKKVVRKNLKNSFPEKSDRERLSIEKKFYAFFCDYIVETLKMFSISDEQMKKRMHFEGVPEMVQALKDEKKLFGFIYLGHYCNWEWVASLSARVYEVDPIIFGGHIYHPLRNRIFDRLLKGIRARFHGNNVPMKETLRKIIELKKAERRTILGFISDQTPKWNSIHHWTQFFNQDTPVFIGTERIGKQVDALIFYADIKRIKRGYYLCKITRMVDDVQTYKDYEVTDLYIRKLEQTIRKVPAYWLWTHNRWKGKREVVE